MGLEASAGVESYAGPVGLSQVLLYCKIGKGVPSDIEVGKVGEKERKLRDVNNQYEIERFCRSTMSVVD